MCQQIVSNKNIWTQLRHTTQRLLVLWLRTKKIQAPQTYHLRIQQEQEYAGFTEITIIIAMESNDDWLANNKTWKKWTGLEDGGLLSYAGIDFHKPKDEEQLVKEIKRRKNLRIRN
jgi:hypothetical protein